MGLGGGSSQGSSIRVVKQIGHVQAVLQPDFILQGQGVIYNCRVIRGKGNLYGFARLPGSSDECFKEEFIKEEIIPINEKLPGQNLRGKRRSVA